MSVKENWYCTIRMVLLGHLVFLKWMKIFTFHGDTTCLEQLSQVEWLQNMSVAMRAFTFWWKRKHASEVMVWWNMGMCRTSYQQTLGLQVCKWMFPSFYISSNSSVQGFRQCWRVYCNTSANELHIDKGCDVQGFRAWSAGARCLCYEIS